MKNSIQTDPSKRLHSRLSDAHVGLLAFLRAIRNEPTFKKQQETARKELEQKLRVQQKPVLNLIPDNPRIIVDGGAGTGKTLIAGSGRQAHGLRTKRVGRILLPDAWWAGGSRSKSGLSPVWSGVVSLTPCKT